MKTLPISQRSITIESSILFLLCSFILFYKAFTMPMETALQEENSMIAAFAGFLLFLLGVGFLFTLRIHINRRKRKHPITWLH